MNLQEKLPRRRSRTSERQCVDFYKVYERWCLDNLEKPLAASTFIHHLKDNQKSLGIVYDDKCIGTNRGFHNVDVDLFLPIDVPSPWD